MNIYTYVYKYTIECIHVYIYLIVYIVVLCVQVYTLLYTSILVFIRLHGIHIYNIFCVFYTNFKDFFVIYHKIQRHIRTRYIVKIHKKQYDISWFFVILNKRQN